MTNITVKKNDNTTDQVWTMVQASGGERSPAIWRNLSVGAAPAFNPEFRQEARGNADGSVRRVYGTIQWPQTVTDANGIIKKVNGLLVKFEVVNPTAMPPADVNEGVSQAFHLLASTVQKDASKAGFAVAS